MKNLKFLIILINLLFLSHLASAQENEADSLPEISITKTQMMQSLLNHTVGIELLIAEPNSSAPIYSKFGHTALRFVTDKQDWTQDVVITFNAEVEEQNISKWKGIVGGYKSQMTVQYFSEQWIYYIKNSGRQIRRKIILTTQEQRNEVIQNALEILKDNKLPDYTFFKNNCAMLLAKLLAGPLKLADLKVRNPAHFPQILEYEQRSLWPDFVVVDYSEVEKKLSKLGLVKNSIKTGKMNILLTTEDIKTVLSDKEIKLLDQLVPHDSQLGTLISPLVDYHVGASLNEALGVQSYPNELYQLCFDDSCRSIQLNLLKDQIGLNAFNKWSDYLIRNVYYEVYSSYKSKEYRSSDPYFINLNSTAKILLRRLAPFG